MSKIKCTHCHLEFDETVMIQDGTHYFCCKGCQGIFHLLQDEGLESFYDKVGSKTLAPPVKHTEESFDFDSDAFYERFVTLNEEGFYESNLIIEGIHCTACVWLNEKALNKLDGVYDIHINYTNNKAHIIWDKESIALSKIVETIRAIGYDAYPYDPSLQEIKAAKERKEYYLRMVVAAFATMNIMWVAVAQYAGYFTGIRQDMKTLLNVAEWALATPVLFYSGWVFFRGAYFGMRNRIVNMDLLVATGATLTYFYSIYITLLEQGEAYFDSVAMIITFVLLGKFLESLSKKKTADTLDILNKQVPAEVKVLEEGISVKKRTHEVKVGDTILLTAGEKAALDGVMLEGNGSFDESSLTGESEPVYKNSGDTIISGTTSIDADITYKATKDFKHSTLSHLSTLLEDALKTKPKIEEMANRMSEHFSTAILVLAFATFIVWWVWPHSFEIALMVGISVIVIACPCALALATPVASLVGLGIGAQRGILFKQSAQIETMAKANVLLLDKTGTITYGKPQVLEASYEQSDAALIYSLVSLSKHPVSLSIKAYLENKGFQKSVALEQFEHIAAKGIKAHFNGRVVLGGNAALLRDNGIPLDATNRMTHFFVAYNEVCIASFGLQDAIKEDSNTSIDKIKALGLEVLMLTGDNEKSACSVAQTLGIDYKAELTPENKMQVLKQYQSEGKHVVMVGDGINDALALATADIGIAMGSGSDIAIDVSDIILLDSSLHSLYASLKISKTTYRLIRQNLALSLVYNAITIPLAMGGYIIPLIAAISMSVSSLLVVGNSMRIKFTYKG